MRLIRSSSPLKESDKGAVIVIGNFDGVHLGHQALIKEARIVANREHVPLAVLTFEPHPSRVFAPKSKPFLITGLREKVSYLRNLGVDFLFLQKFDDAFSKRDALWFITELLGNALKASHLFVGKNFVFGHGRAGNVELLEKCGQSLGFGVTALDLVNKEGEVCSSSEIRKLICKGDVVGAGKLLGRPWEVSCRAVGKDQEALILRFPNNIIQPYRRTYKIRLGIESDGEIFWVEKEGEFVDETSKLLKVSLPHVFPLKVGQRVKTQFIL